MVNYEGFSLSLTSMPVEVPDQREVDDFLPPYESPLGVDFDNPKTFGSLALPQDYDQFKVDIVDGMEKARSVIREVREEYEERFGRDHGDMLDVRKNGGNRLAVVTMGAVACEAEEALKGLDGVAGEVDLIRIRTFRPFPGEELKRELSSADAVLVLDRSISPGAIPPLYSEVMSSIRGLDTNIYGAIVGIGGRDVTYRDVESLVNRSLGLDAEGVEQDLVWWRNGS
jgi:pyruvate/2-oxoacid:ferredoxin oxidoreductase alpha subunit